MKNSFHLLLILLVFTLNYRMPLYAEKIISHFYSSEKPDKELESLLYLAIGIELSKAGFSSVPVDKASDYRLRVEYKSKGTGFSIILNLFPKNKPAKSLATTPFLLHLDETLDPTVTAAVTTLLATANIGTSKSGTEEIAGLLFKPASGDTTLSEPLPVAASGTEAKATTGIAANIVLMTKGLDISVSAGGLMLFGTATDYFQNGAQAALTAGYMIPDGNFVLTPGLRISTIRIFADSDVTGNPLNISTVGFNLQYGIGKDQSFRASGVVSAGGAVLSMVIDRTKLNKMVPYADFGVHTGLPLGNRFFMGAEVRVLTIFDRDLPLIGVVTALALNREF